MSIGVPIKVLQGAEGHIVTCETITGDSYKGKLVKAEDNMLCQMNSVSVTYQDGKTAYMEKVFLRRDKIKIVILPESLENVCSYLMYKHHGIKASSSGAGRGRGGPAQRGEGRANWQGGSGGGGQQRQ